MLPATTISPPAFFKPRRRPALSRPLREDPPAFLCAITALSNSVTVYTDSVKESSHFFLPFVAGFARFLAAGFLALASVSPAASASTLGFGSRLGRSGGVCEGLA